VRLALGLVTITLVGVAWAAAPPSAPVPVTMPGKLFAPGELDVLVGTTVSWSNGDSSTHTVTADSDAFDSGHLRSGQEFSRTFTSTGTFAYHCSIHRSMRGEVRVYAVVLRGPDRPLLPGFAARLEGQAPAGSTEVVLERVTRGARVEIRRAAVGADGEFAFALRSAEPGSYRVRAGEAFSPLVRVPVRPHVSLKRAGRFLLVLARPVRPGSRVVLQVYDRERFDWVTVARSRLDASSRARVTLAAGRKAHVRAVVRGRGGWSDGISPVLVVR